MNTYTITVKNNITRKSETFHIRPFTRDKETCLLKIVTYNNKEYFEVMKDNDNGDLKEICGYWIQEYTIANLQLLIKGR